MTCRKNGKTNLGRLQKEAEMDEIEKLKACIADLLLVCYKAKRGHDYCEDSWYSCPKAEDGCGNDAEGDECNCGAEQWNARLDEVIARYDGYNR